MAIDLIARGLAASLIGLDGKIASDKLPVFGEVTDTAGFIPIGGVTDPSLLEGKTAEEVVLMMLFSVVTPTLTSPSLSLDLSSSATVIAGQENIISGTLRFNRGTIVPALGTSGFRAGEPTSYVFAGTYYTTSALEVPFSIAYTPVLGENKIAYSVHYSEGEQPLDSKGQPFGAPLAAGTITKTLVMNALYQLYSAEGELLDFTYFKEKDGQGYLTTLSSESSGIKQSFAVAEGVTVVGVKQYDMITSSWSWIGGSAQASLETFDTTVLSGTALNEPRNYICYTHNGSDRSARELRIYVTYN